MSELTIIKKGRSLQPCINLPVELQDMDLEVRIRPVRPKADVKQKLKDLFSAHADISPFEDILEADRWQKEIRNEWE